MDIDQRKTEGRNCIHMHTDTLAVFFLFFFYFLFFYSAQSQHMMIPFNGALSAMDFMYGISVRIQPPSYVIK